MLTRFHKILLGVLAAQLALVVIVFLSRGDGASLRERPLFAGLDAATATRIQIVTSDPSNKPVDLVKRDANWVVASAFDYPVEATRVTDLLTAVTKLSVGEPIASQASRHKQLRVGDTDFERKAVITAGGKDYTLYLGNGVGTRRITARRGGDDNVYSVSGITAATLGNEATNWVASSYVNVAVADMTKVVVQRDGTSVELTRPPSAAPEGSGSAAPPAPPAAERWTATIGGAPITLAANETIDDSAIDRVINTVASLHLNSPADPKRDASKPTATVTIERKAPAAPVVIDIIADGESYWVHDRSLPRAVLINKAQLLNVVSVSRDTIVKKPPPATATPPGATPGMPPGMPPGMAPGVPPRAPGPG